MAPENERDALSMHYMHILIKRGREQRERERYESDLGSVPDFQRAEREQDERYERYESDIYLVPESQRAAVLLARQTLLLAREKTKQMKLAMRSKSPQGTSYLTIFIITVDTV